MLKKNKLIASISLTILIEKERKINEKIIT